VCVGKEKNVIKNFLDGGGNDTGDGNDGCAFSGNGASTLASMDTFNSSARVVLP